MTIWPELTLRWSSERTYGSYLREFDSSITRYKDSNIKKFIDNDIYTRIEFKDYLVNCVNRTWYYDTTKTQSNQDVNQIDYISDKLWFLGVGNINSLTDINKTRFFDWTYDTSKFNNVFLNNTDATDELKAKNIMDWDGSVLLIRYYPNWMLRSASNIRTNIGYVSYGGSVGYGSYNLDYGIAPACIIA